MAVLRDPFIGIGEPEALNICSLGVVPAQEHRLVYRVSGNRIDFLQSRYTTTTITGTE